MNRYEEIVLAEYNSRKYGQELTGLVIVPFQNLDDYLINGMDVIERLREIRKDQRRWLKKTFRPQLEDKFRDVLVFFEVGNLVVEDKQISYRDSYVRLSSNGNTLTSKIMEDRRFYLFDIQSVKDFRNLCNGDNVRVTIVPAQITFPLMEHIGDLHTVFAYIIERNPFDSRRIDELCIEDISMLTSRARVWFQNDEIFGPSAVYGLF